LYRTVLHLHLYILKSAFLYRVVLRLQVYILSRMGNSRAALALIIERLQDIPRAIEFVRLQRDEELIEELIDWALRSADTTGVTLCLFFSFLVLCFGFVRLLGA
jgi:hypothetical protein